MSDLPLIELFSLLLLFVLSAFFSSSETALFSLNPIQIRRLRGRHPHAADTIEGLLHRPTRLLSTILIGNTLVNVTAAGLGFVVAEQMLPHYAEAVSIITLTLFLLVFGEVAPKRAAMVHAEKIAVIYAPILRVLLYLTTPLRLVLERVSALFGPNEVPTERTLSEDEFLSVVETGEEAGILDEEERTMVDGIVGMEETQASDIMTPRVDLVGIDMEDTPAEQDHIARSVTYRYLPLYRKTLDHVEGFLDVLKFLVSDGHDISKATLPAAFVPETAPLDNLLREFQSEARRVAIVSDEFGGTAGLLTRGDILEEIVEDVDDEFDERKLSIQQTENNNWLIDGSTSLEDINYELELELEAEGADRIAGWVLDQMERIPRTGDVITAQGCRVRVQRVRHQRITLVSLHKEPSDPTSAEKEDVRS
jgi:putative hemolysin